MSFPAVNDFDDLKKKRRLANFFLDFFGFLDFVVAALYDVSVLPHLSCLLTLPG